MRVTPLDIQQRQFKVKFKGFDRQEVESFLELISNEMEELIGEINALKKDLVKKEGVIDGYQAREKSINESIIMAQRIAEDMKLNTEKEAELILSEAEIEAERIISKATHELANMKSEIVDLKKQRLQFDSELRSLIEVHLKMLGIGREETVNDG